MSWTLGQVKARVGALLDAVGPNTYLTDDFIVPLISQVYEDACAQLLATQGQWDIVVVEVPGIQPGTPNLADLQSGTGPLAQLSEQPTRLEWKPAGNPPSTYQLVRNYEVLPTVQPRESMLGWEWRSEVIWLTNCSIAVDLRVRGEFAPPPVVEDDDVLTAHPLIGLPVSYGTASLVAVVRGNNAWATQYNGKAMEKMDDIMGAIVRSTQGVTRRLGRIPRRGGWGGNWPAPL